MNYWTREQFVEWCKQPGVKFLDKCSLYHDFAGGYGDIWYFEKDGNKYQINEFTNPCSKEREILWSPPKLMERMACQEGDGI